MLKWSFLLPQQEVSYSCFEDEELCIEEIHFNQSVAGQCVELKFEGKIAGIPSYAYRNICVPQQTPETGKSIISLIIFLDAVQMLLSAGSV